MILSSEAASQFISGYTQLMVEICCERKGIDLGGGMSLLEAIVSGRSEYLKDRAALESAENALDEKGLKVSDDVRVAVEGMEVKDWIYLKDTKAYSVLIDPSMEMAYGVMSLTEPLRSIIGGSGALLEVGILPFRGSYITDSVVTRVVWLGRNYKLELQEGYRNLRSQGRFRSKCAL
jgi:hypothetical protein